jgi:hypothetical protein
MQQFADRVCGVWVCFVLRINSKIPLRKNKCDWKYSYTKPTYAQLIYIIILFFVYAHMFQQSSTISTESIHHI